MQSCVRYLYASETEAACFSEEYVESIGHYTVVPNPVAAANGIGVQGVVVGDAGHGLSLGRISELDAAACGFCARAAEAMLSELPTSIEEDEHRLMAAANARDALGGVDDETAQAQRRVLALEYRLGVKKILRAFARDCSMQTRCNPGR